MSVDVPRTIGGRYVLHDELASGGMATVHIGKLIGAAGFSRPVAIKRLHPQYAKEDDFVSMFIDEARIAARIRHPNVVATLDTVYGDGELFLVMELVMGEPISRLVRSPTPIPVDVAVGIMSSALHGLHAAHEATDERGNWLEIVHRDVSPQNVLVGVDGIARVLDFGVAKALGRIQTTRDGQVKGKVAYMAPEQLRGGVVDRRTDVYAAAVVLWEMLAHRRLFVSETPGEILARVLEQKVEPPSRFSSDVPAALDDVVMRGLQRNPDQRFASAHEMALALEHAIALPTQSKVARWVNDACGERISARAQLIARIDSDSHVPVPTASSAASVTQVPPDPSTQLSTTLDAPRRARAPRLAVIAALGALVLIAGGATWRSLRTTEPAKSPSAAPAASPAVAPAPAAPAPAPAPVPAASPAPAADVGSARATKPSPAKTRPVRDVRKRKPNCNPPYTVDKDGIHIPKKECR
jgi:serine/threonine protein kinase